MTFTMTVPCFLPVTMKACEFLHKILHSQIHCHHRCHRGRNCCMCKDLGAFEVAFWGAECRDCKDCLQCSMLCSGCWRISSIWVSSWGAAAALLPLLSLLYLWVRRWHRLREEEKNRLVLLLKEKDQKISQLLLQIAKMSEMFSAHRRVPVVRIGGMIAHGQPT